MLFERILQAALSNKFTCETINDDITAENVRVNALLVLYRRINLEFINTLQNEFLKRDTNENSQPPSFDVL